jgi:hypothetical protein
VKPAREAVPDWLRDMEQPFKPLARDNEALQPEAAAKPATGRNRGVGSYANRAMTTAPGKGK